MQTAERSCNLDLLRSIAIASVVAYHICGMLPRNNYFAVVAAGGQYGVDLFFVLSGFLIGRLYWIELAKHGNVDGIRFYLRRVLRTVPPYLVAYCLSWIAVWLARGEEFDVGYLVFVQNYYDRIPYFLISWSLCIEEQFYLILPLALPGVLLFGRSPMIAALGCAILVPMFCRCLVFDSQGQWPFGYYYTAFHLRYEGLLLGVVAAYLSTKNSAAFGSIGCGWRRVAVYTCAAAFAFSMPYFPVGFSYRFGPTLLALLFTAVTLVASFGQPHELSRVVVVRPIAVSSYSVYLTHALAIHVGLQVSQLLSIDNLLCIAFVMLAGIVICAIPFYFWVERTAIRMRDRYCPRRMAIYGPNPDISLRASIVTARE